jgi:hypothetical protein
LVAVLPPAEENKEIKLPNPPTGTKWHTLPGYEGGEKEFKGEEKSRLKENAKSSMMKEKNLLQRARESF